MAAILIAAMMPAVLTTILSISLASLLPGFVNYMSWGSMPVIAAALPAQLFLTFLVASVLPSAIFVLCTHYIARTLRRNRALVYAAIGGLMAALCAYQLSSMVPLAPISLLMIISTAYGSIMGALYRRFIGLAGVLWSMTGPMLVTPKVKPLQASPDLPTFNPLRLD